MLLKQFACLIVATHRVTEAVKVPSCYQLLLTYPVCWMRKTDPEATKESGLGAGANMAGMCAWLPTNFLSGHVALQAAAQQQPQPQQATQPAIQSAVQSVQAEQKSAHAAGEASGHGIADPRQMLRIADSAAQHEEWYKAKLQEAQASCATAPFVSHDESI